MEKKEYATKEQYDRWLTTLRELGYGEDDLPRVISDTTEKTKDDVRSSFMAPYMRVGAVLFGVAAPFLFGGAAPISEGDYIMPILDNFLLVAAYALGFVIFFAISSVIVSTWYCKKEKRTRIISAVAAMVIGAIVLSIYAR